MRVPPPLRENMKRDLDTHESARALLRNRASFLQLLLSEDLSALSAELGVSAQTLSRWRWNELSRLKSLVGGLPDEDEIFDRELFERRRAV